MAIDTATKRKAASGLKPFKKIVVPDGSIAALDRTIIACLYGGLAEVTRIVLTLKARSLSMTLPERDLAQTLKYRDLTLGASERD